MILGYSALLFIFIITILTIRIIFLYDSLVNNLAKLDRELDEIQKERYRRMDLRYWSSF
jgi:hypothetical protein